MEDDTIVAISTAPGRGALGVVRISGPDSARLGKRLCPAILTWKPRRALHAKLTSDVGGVLDDAVVLYFEAPRSFTGEHMLEVSCHGSPLILDRVVERILALGARAARPGEFTLRAFLNGKLDLAQAEAVVDLVEARTEAGLRLAMQQLAGKLSGEVSPLRGDLLDLLAHVTALVDFSEEDIPEVEVEEIRRRLEAAGAHIARLLAGARAGHVLGHGVSLAITGAPNVGKSSILNDLLRRDRAIVTPIAGTTRDTLEEELSLDGILFRVVDTAGIGQSRDAVEAIGIERSRVAVSAADYILLVVDGSRPLDRDASDAIEMLQNNGTMHRTLIALNKADLPAFITPHEAGKWMQSARVVCTSTVTEGGLEGLREALPRLAIGGPVPDGFVISNARHVQALRDAAEALERASNGQNEGLPLDLLSYDLRSAVEALGQIVGIGIGDEVLDRVFSRFCIGK